MQTRILGTHHVTAIAGDAQRNVDFYAGVFGLRLIKLTVNFDDPGTYHIYYGDGIGGPGTILTFFPWLSVGKGRQGAGQVGAIALAIPATALAFWARRLQQHGIRHEPPAERFGEQVLSLRDPDGLPIELIASAAPDGRDVRT